MMPLLNIRVFVLFAGLLLQSADVRASAIGGDRPMMMRVLPADLPRCELGPDPTDPWDTFRDDDVRARAVVLFLVNQVLAPQGRKERFDTYASGDAIGGIFDSLVVPAQGASVQFPDPSNAARDFEQFLHAHNIVLTHLERPVRRGTPSVRSIPSFPYHLALRVLQLLPDQFYHLTNAPGQHGQQLFQEIRLHPAGKTAVMKYDVPAESLTSFGTGKGRLTVYSNSIRTARQFMGVLLHELGHNWEKSLRRTNEAAHQRLLALRGLAEDELQKTFPYVWPMAPGNREGRMVYLLSGAQNEPLAEIFMMYVWDGALLRQYMRDHREDAAGRFVTEVYQAIRQALGVEYHPAPPPDRAPAPPPPPRSGGRRRGPDAQSKASQPSRLAPSSPAPKRP